MSALVQSALVQSDVRVSQYVAVPRKMLIGGQWVEAASGKTFPTYNPATGEVLANVVEGDKEDIDRAVRAARQAFPIWSNLPPAERSKMLWRLGDLIEENLDELAQLETLDNGKPLSAAQAFDIPFTADHFRYMAGWATKIEGASIPLSLAPGGSFHAYTLREPVGVVGQIIPWNFPLLMAAWKIAPALAAGCTVVLKPAEQTPLTALRLGELLLEAGFPAGVLNIVPGFGETAGAALAAHPDVNKVAFTGSTEVGKLIVQAAAGSLKKVSLELGGKSPNIIFRDADLEQAIPQAAGAIFFNQGEICTAGSRLFVEQAVFDQVVEGVADRAKSIRLGPGMASDTEMGPLISEEQLARVCGYLESGVTEGAEVVAGGRKRDGAGYFVEPTVLVNTNPEMKVVREEIFGPVVTVIPFQEVDDIAAISNETVYGLAAAVWTRDISKAHRLASALQSGNVWINCYNAFDNALPFGGYKQSGWGRELGREGVEQYTQTKTVCVKL